MIIQQSGTGNLRDQTNLNAALRLIGEGWRVLPTKLDKSPHIRDWPKRATDDPEQAREWWGSRWPDANLGRLTGQISGRYILDLDSKVALNESDRRGLPETHAVWTGRINRHGQTKPMGSGFQFVFNATDEPLDTCVLFPGAELRAENAYCVAPPSQHPSGRYYKEIPSLSGRLADLPAWIIELAQERHQRDTETLTPLTLDPSGPAILDGERNRTLFRVACSLRARGAGHAQIAGHLAATNLARCTPPLGHAEVERIAKSATRYQPGNAAPQVTPEVLAMLDGYEAAVRSEPWKGSGGYSDRDVLLGLVEFARLFGSMANLGVDVVVSHRDLAPVAGISRPTLIKSLHERLKPSRWLLTPNAHRSPQEAGTFTLPSKRAHLYHSTTSVSTKSGTSGKPLRVPALRHGGLGKKAGATLGKLAELGGTATVKELADALHDPRPWELKRRQIAPLVKTGVVELEGVTVTLRKSWESSLLVARGDFGELAREQADRVRYEMEREKFRDRR